MGLFSRKPKVGIEEFCREFYDKQIFHAMIGGIDAWSAFLETVFNSISEADQSFAVIDKAVFQREMKALRMELFGLAWSHKFKGEEFTLPQSFFTKHYLEENGRLDIWDIMGEYNQALAKSSVMTATGEQMGTEYVISINKLRSDMFDKWTETNIGDRSVTEEDEEHAKCVARVANRIGADLMKNKEIGNRRITALLLYRLGWKIDEDLSEEALSRLVAITFGLYEGAKEAIKSVNLQAS